MPSKHLSLHYHLVFSTKNREPWLSPAHRSRVHEYIGGILRGMNGIAHAVGGTGDSVRSSLHHPLISLPLSGNRIQSPSRLHERSRTLSKLHWARESLSERQLADVENLIATGCDMDYLKEWSARLNLTDMLTRVSP